MLDTIRGGDVVELKDNIGIEMVVELVSGGLVRCVPIDGKELVLKQNNVNVAALEKAGKGRGV